MLHGLASIRVPVVPGLQLTEEIKQPFARS